MLSNEGQQTDLHCMSGLPSPEDHIQELASASNCDSLETAIAAAQRKLAHMEDSYRRMEEAHRKSIIELYTEVQVAQCRLEKLPHAEDVQRTAPQARPMSTQAAMVEEENVSDVCIVCLDATSTHAMIPCGHKCVCAACASVVGEHCPVCRTSCQGSMHIFSV